MNETAKKYIDLFRPVKIALAAMCPGCQSLKFTGKLRVVGREWVDKVFEHNSGMNEVYPGESRCILDAFHIYQGRGEWFDPPSAIIDRPATPFVAQLVRRSREFAPRA